ELGVELGKALAVEAARERIGAVLDRPTLEAAQTFQYILRPAYRLAELAVAYHVNPDLCLAAHDIGDAGAEAFLIRRGVECPAGLLEPQEIEQRLRPDEAADVGGEDAFGAAFHASLSGIISPIASMTSIKPFAASWPISRASSKVLP